MAQAKPQPQPQPQDYKEKHRDKDLNVKIKKENAEANVKHAELKKNKGEFCYFVREGGKMGVGCKLRGVRDDDGSSVFIYLGLMLQYNVNAMSVLVLIHLLCKIDLPSYSIGRLHCIIKH